MSDEFQHRWTEVVRLYPAKTALCEGNRRISYETLHHRANQYANGLIEQGFHLQCIPVLLDDPVEHVAALLGVLLSGNYYHSVRILSADDLTVLLDSRSCPALINDLPVVLPDRPTLPTLVPDQFQTDGSALISPPLVLPENPFCLFTTSGSTGQPKQVIHSHQSVLADTYRQITDNEITSDDRIDLLFSLEFSASLACLFPAFLTGATLVFHDLRKEGVLSLPTFWERQNITFSSLSVSTFRMLLKTDADFKKLTGLRFLSIGAEPVRPADVSGFQERFFINTTLQVAYATTETRTISEHKVRIDTPVSEQLFSVGKPVSGRAVSIRSETGEILPPNQVGEITVQARFIPSAYPTNRDASLRAYQQLPDGTVQYATGDLGFLDADGYLFWCGRTDFVVKINGQKVSLIQLEHELKNEPGVKNAAVIYDTSQAARCFLTAFLCVEPDFELAVLKQTLAQRLPLVMLPDRYILLDALPLTKTGKVDRMRLAAHPVTENPIADNSADSAENPTDLVALIKAIWQRELGLTTTLSDYDDFFQDLGGDSLTAESCLAALENRLGKTMPVHAVFSYTTPKALAYYITGYSQHRVQCIPLNKPERNRKAVYFIPPLPGERRMYRWIENLLNLQYNLYFVHYEPYTTEGNLIAFPELIEQIAQAIPQPAESVLIGFSFGGLVAYQVARALEQSGRPALSRLVLLDTPLYRRITFRESLRNDAYRIGRKVVEELRSKQRVDWKAGWQRIVARYRKRFKNRSAKPVMISRSISWQESCLAAVHRYTQQITVAVPVSCPIVLFRATQTVDFQYEIRPDFRWQLYTTAGFEEHFLEAYHGQVLNSTNSHIIGTILCERLYSNPAKSGDEQKPVRIKRGL
ncbi:AMP-binding protein [Larkinella terrae]|uniref:AMP-binding protein n=1 Tax=Larkinella terrae TaxID=2025311 RepID=A0A7K0EP53_9BACT|nr:AMP-binding protein [Larkinella terrae]MRS63341.1 AMP-binding protein [Larkinella terrae]